MDKYSFSMTQMIEEDKQKALLNWLKLQGKPCNKALYLLSGSALLAFCLQLLMFWFVATATESILIDKQVPEYSLFVLLVCVMLLLLGVERVRLRVAQVTENKLYALLQNQLFEQLSKGQFAFVRQHSTYFWQQLWLNHIPSVVQFNVRYLVQQRFVVAVPFIVLACVLPLNWLVGLSLLISLPIVPVFMILVGKGAANLHRKHFKALARLGSVFVDRIRALELLRTFNAHDSQAKVISTASDALNVRTMRVVGVAFLSSSVLDFFSTLAVALVAVFVGFNLLGEFNLGGKLSLHSGLFLLLSAPLCFSELKQLGRLYHLRAEAIAASEELSCLLQDNQFKNQSHVDANGFSSIHWQGFEVKTPHIRASDICLNQGDWVYLQGTSGSGKTCFLEGLMGQRDSTHAFNHAVLISQHAIILPVSIRENLQLDATYPDEELIAALQKVELDGWLAQQKQGLDTLLDEQIPMSGGQKQRLALARVLLSNAEIVFLDEPTAHLTDDQHLRLSQMIKRTLSDKTLIWASHKHLPNDWFSKKWQMRDGVLTT